MAEEDVKPPIEEETKVEKKEKKLYKGDVRPVKTLQSSLSGPTPVQPVKQRFTRMGHQAKVPPTFIVTKFSAGYAPNSVMMKYYDPKSGLSAQVDVPEDFELNVLSGKRAEELKGDWNKTLGSALARLVQRLSCTVGTDPEIFVVDKKGVVPAWTFLGSKKVPTPWHLGSNTGDLYWDGFQAEFTTPGYTTCLVELGNYIRAGLAKLVEMKPKGTKLSLASVLPVEPKVLVKAEDEHVAFGCAPSKNVYGLRGNTEEGRVVPYRFAGGHIHLGLNDDAKKVIPEIVKALDAVVGVASVSLFASYDSPIRRKFYGQPGEYRTPPHGLEYRVLSNAWLCHPAVYHAVFDLTRAVAGVVTSGVQLKDLWSTSEDETIHAIMNSDVSLARRILSENQRVFTQLLYIAGSVYAGQAGQKVALDGWTGGLEAWISEPENFEKNWCLGDNSGKWTYGPRTFGQSVTSIAAGKKV